jgi:hypothetical protein
MELGHGLAVLRLGREGDPDPSLTNIHEKTIPDAQAHKVLTMCVVWVGWSSGWGEGGVRVEGNDFEEE